jgi:hypothetical protein
LFVPSVAPGVEMSSVSGTQQTRKMAVGFAITGYSTGLLEDDEAAVTSETSIYLTTGYHLKDTNPKNHLFSLSKFIMWSLILRQEHRLRVLEKKVLRRIFGPERDEVTGGWRKLHNE